jgi:hypothetical protein
MLISSQFHTAYARQSILAARSDAKIWRQFSADRAGRMRAEHWRQILARLDAAQGLIRGSVHPIPHDKLPAK